MTLDKVKRVLYAIGIFASGIAAGMTGFLLLRENGLPADAEAGAAKKKEEVKHEIENTPAAVLAAAASNSDALRADAERIAGNAKERLRDRSRKIISGKPGAGDTPDSGNGN
jgi:hypothetical protein